MGIYVPRTVDSQKVTVEYTTIIAAGYSFDGVTTGTFFNSNTALGNISGWKSVVQPVSQSIRASLTDESLCSFLSIDSSGNVNLTKTGYYQGGILLFGIPHATDGSQQTYVFGMAPFISINSASLVDSFFGYPGFYGMPFVFPSGVTTSTVETNSTVFASQPFQFYYNGTVPLPLSMQIFSSIRQPNNEFGLLTMVIGIQRMDHITYIQ
jgi:hypothetical protein